MPERQSPIFTKTYDFLLWLLNHTEQFPKSERFRLAKRLDDSAFLFYEKLMKAVRTSRTRSLLYEADLELERLRLYVRLCHARSFLTLDQYQYASGIMIEIGKLLGGWLKMLPESSSD